MESPYYPGKIILRDEINNNRVDNNIELTKEILSQNKMILTMNQDLLKTISSLPIIIHNENNLTNKEE